MQLTDNLNYNEVKVIRDKGYALSRSWADSLEEVRPQETTIDNHTRSYTRE